jgi:epoxyqueuosine reductase
MTAEKAGEVSARRIENVVKEFVASSPENAMWEGGAERMWAEPLVGFSRGDDPLYQQIKEDIGSFYWTPRDAYALAFPDEAGVQPAELTVANWVLPQTEATRIDNRRQRKYPSHRWSRTRLFGEKFNDLLRSHVVAVLRAAGVDAVAPVLSPSWSGAMSDRYGFASNWSERHAAYVSGLGTFGLCDGLITPVGKAMRCGSVIVRAALPPTERPYADIHAYCLFYSRGTCGACMQRCPVGAVTAAGHDKNTCLGFLGGVALPYSRKQYKVDIYSCGLCQTAVPCESRIPRAR